MAYLQNLCIDEHCMEVVDAYTKPEVNALLIQKQDKLTAGTGIEITSGNVINSTIDADVFIPVTTLPDASTADSQKIYLTPKTGGGVEEWHVIDNGGTPAWDKFGEADIDLSKEHLLEILDLEEVEYTMTECDGTSSTYILLARRQVIYEDTWGVAFYAGGLYETEITVDSIDIYAGNALIGHTSWQSAYTDIDGNGGLSAAVNTPASNTSLRIVMSGVSCDGSTKSNYEGTADLVYIEGEGAYIENVSFTGSGCIEVEAIYVE